MKTETISLATTTDQASVSGEGGWWQAYADGLRSQISSSAVRVVDLDSTYVVERGIFGTGGRDKRFAQWPEHRTRRGLVMGAVQSGKTASLLAVTAKALDAGVDIVVVLAGTRTSLWRQTYERLAVQLDRWEPQKDEERRLKRVLLPAPHAVFNSGAAPSLEDLYFENPSLVRRMVLSGRPLVAVVMKQVDHLERFAKFLRRVLQATLPRSSSPLHLLILDDEADDGSILDSVAETGLSFDSDGLKQIPRSIVRLWSDSVTGPDTFDERVYATYIAYTATPQANFLQSDHNPLAPSDFVVSLRVPFDKGAVEPPRSATFLEEMGLPAYYTGGDAYYRRFARSAGALCVDRIFPEREPGDTLDVWADRISQAREQLLADALRAYFVSGAVKLFLSKRSLTRVRSLAPCPLEQLEEILPLPHSMLFHPSARVESHFEGAAQVAKWTGAESEDWARGANCNAAGLAIRLLNEEDDWKKWLLAFDDARRVISFLPGGESVKKVSVEDWPAIKTLLMEEVFPNCRIEVINSDPRAEDRPRFEPIRNDEGLFSAPPHIYTIFVSGNVMARGVTLEGLTTSLFLRAADEPASDTQMQMQRWFGYRGRYLHLCRVFLFSDQLELFAAYHQTDEALRAEILGEMNLDADRAPRPSVLQGTGFKATAKIANLRALPLCPGADPFIKVVDDGRFANQNLEILKGLLAGSTWDPVQVGRSTRGMVMQQQLSLLEVAGLLERFQYENHDPSPKGLNHQRWRSLASANGILAPDAPLFRPPDAGGGTEAVSPNSCPYTIAAYLRFWHALLRIRAPGIFPTDDPSTPWSMLNLREYAATVPLFYVGIRYGAEGEASDATLRASGIQVMRRGTSNGFVLSSTWGSRNPGSGSDAYLGDQLFDYHVHEHRPPRQAEGEPLWRPRGAPGLLLFHVLKGPGEVDLITAGLGLPQGGPDHIAALRPHG